MKFSSWTIWFMLLGIAGLMILGVALFGNTPMGILQGAAVFWMVTLVISGYAYFVTS